MRFGNWRDPDIAQTTNADILAGVLDVPLLPELAENVEELPSMAANFGSWRVSVSVN